MGLYLTSADYVVWGLGILLECVLLGVLIRRMRSRIFPWFTAYIAYCTVRSFALFFISQTASAEHYYAAYVAGAFAGVLILFAVAHEVFIHVFRPIEALPERAVAWGAIAGMLLVVIACAVALTLGSSSHPHLMGILLAIERSTAFVLASIFGSIALFSSFLGLPWRRHVLGVVLGFHMYFAALVVVTAVVSVIPAAASRVVLLIPRVAFVCAETIWLCCFLRPEPARSEVSPAFIAFVEHQVREMEKILVFLRALLAGAPTGR